MNSYPYTRGLYNSVYRRRLWTMRVYAGLGAAKAAEMITLPWQPNGRIGMQVFSTLETRSRLHLDRPCDSVVHTLPNR